MSDSRALECGDYRDPAAPLTIHTLRTLKMARHLQTNQPGCCVKCAQATGQFYTMQPINPDTLQCPVCGATRGT